MGVSNRWRCGFRNAWSLVWWHVYACVHARSHVTRDRTISEVREPSESCAPEHRKYCLFGFFFHCPLFVLADLRGRFCLMVIRINEWYVLVCEWLWQFTGWTCMHTHTHAHIHAHNTLCVRTCVQKWTVERNRNHRWICPIVPTFRLVLHRHSRTGKTVQTRTGDVAVEYGCTICGCPNTDKFTQSL